MTRHLLEQILERQNAVTGLGPGLCRLDHTSPLTTLPVGGRVELIAFTHPAFDSSRTDFVVL